MFTPFSFSRFEFRVKQHETEDPKLQRTSRLLKKPGLQAAQKDLRGEAREKPMSPFQQPAKP
jgi:hypothetical protein